MDGRRPRRAIRGCPAPLTRPSTPLDAPRLVGAHGSYTPPIMTRVPVPSNPLLADWTARAFDRDRKLVRVLGELGPIAERDITLMGSVPPWLVAELRLAGARIVGRSAVEPPAADSSGPGPEPVDRASSSSADIVLAAWSALRGAEADEIAGAVALLRPGGRLLAIHDYGRDQIDALVGDRPESAIWSRRGGPFTSAGFKIRVVHCWWTFDSLEEAARFLDAAFGDASRELAAGLRRPRISHNVAIYHRDAAPD